MFENKNINDEIYSLQNGVVRIVEKLDEYIEVKLEDGSSDYVEYNGEELGGSKHKLFFNDKEEMINYFTNL